MSERKAITSRPINDLIAKRWSPRIFDPNKRVNREQLIKICEAGRWAPSCGNDQPYRYIIWDRFSNNSEFERAFQCLDKWNKNWVKNCPILLVAIANKNFRNGDPHRWSQYDTGAASENMCLQATDLGLFAHQMAGFDEEKLAMEFDIPPNFTPMAMMAIGYKSHDLSLVHEKYQKTEQEDRFRRPLSSTFFEARWKNPLVE